MQTFSGRLVGMFAGIFLGMFAAGSGGACSSNGSGGEDGPDGGGGGPTMLNGEKYTATWGPVTVPPGEENTQCAVLTLNNPTPVKIHQMRNVLGDASHHMIVYRDDASAPNATPVDCKPFAGTLTATAATSPIMITQRHEEMLTLPDGVAYSFQANQKIRLEMHYLNATTSPQTITATAEFYAAYPEQVRAEADFLFIGNPDLRIGPASSPTFTSYFTPPASLYGVNFFAITGHTHQYGTSVDISTAAGVDQPRTSIYAPRPFLWSEPETKMMSPAFQLPEGGGFEFSCAYRNPTSRTIEFGESTDDEMCFFWAYYYPSKGSRVCVHSTRVNAPAGVDVCCPAEAGDLLSELVCNIITSQL
jgi:hypothetical protein